MSKYIKFLEKSNLIHNYKYDYSEFVYLTYKTKSIIICKKHGKFLQSSNHHIRGQGCPWCGNDSRKISKSKTLDLFIKQAHLAHNNKYDYSKFTYNNSHTKSIIVCNKHGEFLQTPSSHLSKSGCPLCAKNKLKTLEQFIISANMVHQNKYDYSKFVYVNSTVKGIIICHIHNVEFSQVPPSHLKGKIGCAKCINKIKNYDDFVLKSNLIHNYKYDYSKFVYYNSNTNGIIICPKHGEFLQRPNNHLNKSGCNKCSHVISSLEIAWLDSLNVPQEYRHKILKINGKKI